MFRRIHFILPFIVLIVTTTLSGCDSKTAKAETISSFLEGIVQTEDAKINLNEPIPAFRQLAQKQAAKTIVLTKSNMSAALDEARQYKHAIIVVGKHTILKITDFDDCQKSTSWGAKMPYGEGYVQNDGMSNKSDYVNQIIGMPDKQTRWLFLFN
jgi:predicted DNA-binding protein (UPF0251 family)